jgi:CRISPR-associated protein Cas8a1/Csx13
MAKRVKQAAANALGDLVIGLSDPGMTPILRAGLGGLAASLHALLRAQNRDARWPSPIVLGPGRAVVTPRNVTIQWNGAAPEVVLRPLFEASFQISSDGLISLPGTWKHAPRLALAVALQSGMKRTFLQHGKTTTKAGNSVIKTEDVGDQQIAIEVQPYAGFAHQTADADVVRALHCGSIELAGWAYPGAVQRHVGCARTRITYGPGAALCGLFALVGCLPFDVPRSSGCGALAIAEPSDLLLFARIRPLLTPRKPEDAHVTGVGDALLSMHLALRMSEYAGEPGIGTTHGVLLRATPWATQQKSRVAVVTLETVPGAVLDTYKRVAAALPTKYRRREVDDADETGSFVATSALRAFVTDNIARDVPWHRNFATATNGDKKPRFIHYYRDRDRKNLGALYPEERKGLLVMLKHLEESERVLVSSVHTALKQRFGKIAEESKESPATMKNRFRAEREKWRLSFAGAKTPDQVRAALADLWSRAGTVRELQSGWEQVLPLLREGQWRTARDLALVALASYQGGGVEVDDDE